MRLFKTVVSTLLIVVMLSAPVFASSRLARLRERALERRGITSSETVTRSEGSLEDGETVSVSVGVSASSEEDD